MPTLFDLYATLGLDTTDFKEQAEAAMQDGETVADNISRSFDSVDSAAETAETALDDVEKKSKDTGAFAQGVASAVEAATEAIIEGIIDFAAESLTIASQSGSAIAEEYLKAQERLDVSTQALKLKVGNLLLPAATAFSDFAATLTGVTDSDRLLVMLDHIDSYAFENIQSLSTSLDSVFGRFEKVEYGDGMNVEDMTAALDSQIEYWNQYNQTLSALQSRGVDTSFLSSLADGTVQSFETLKALEQADQQQLDTIIQSFQTLEETKNTTVSALSEMQLSVDENFAAMQESVNGLIEGMDPETAFYASKALGDGVASGLADSYPGISSWVDTINSKLQTVGSGFQPQGITFADTLNQSFSTNEMGFPYWRPYASGINYVPYDGYRAELHAGEAVLPRQAAEAYRASETGVQALDVNALADAIISGMAGLSVNMDGKRVGELVTATVSRNIAREARDKRRYGA